MQTNRQLKAIEIKGKPEWEGNDQDVLNIYQANAINFFIEHLKPSK